jgi:hypothetical protein
MAPDRLRRWLIARPICPTRRRTRNGRGAQAAREGNANGNAGMGRFRHRSLHVEMTDFALPARAAHARGAVTNDAIPHELDVSVVILF